jgi:hypothetical protein
MNESESVARANAFVTALEAFAVAHPFITAWAAAWVLSWLVTWTFKKPIRALLPDEWDAWGVRAFDVHVAGVAAFVLLKLLHIPVAWLVVAAGIIGFSSPIGYFLLSAAACWKWPGLRRYLTLRELAPDPAPAEDTGDDVRIPKDPPT